MDKTRQLLLLRKRKLELVSQKSSTDKEMDAFYKKHPSLPDARTLDGSYTKELVKNAIPSTINEIASTASALWNYKESAQGMRGLVNALGNKGADLVGSDIFQQYSEEPANVLGKDYSDRYGSASKILNSFKNDPARTFGDLSMASGPAKLARLSKLSKTLQAIDPINAIVNTGVKGVQGASKVVAPWLMKGVLKKPKKLKFKDYNESIQLALDENLRPHEWAAEKLRGMEKLNADEVTKIISKHDNTGKYTLAPSLTDDITKELSKMKSHDSLNPNSRYSNMSNVKRDFLEPLPTDTRNFIAQSMIEPSELQKLKRSIYQEVNWDRASLKGATEATVDAQKSIARKAMKRLEGIDDKVIPLNKDYEVMANIAGPLDDAIMQREGSRLIELSPLVGANVGGTIAGETGRVVGAGLGFLDRKLPKAGLAVLLNNLGKSTKLKGLGTNQLSRLMLRQAATTGLTIEELMQQAIDSQ